MGANLIGYTLIRPAKGADRIADLHVHKLKTILADETLTDKRKVSALCRAGVYIEDYEEPTDAEFIQTVKDEIEALKEVDSTLFYRDVNSRYATVRKKKVEIIFAGDMSWGDEPQGAGYEALKSFVTLGISDAWERALK